MPRTATSLSSAAARERSWAGGNDVLRVFLYAPRERRVAHIVEHFGVDTKTAEKEVDRVDKGRAAYLRDWYSLVFGDPANYDLLIDTSALGDDKSAATIVEAVRTRE